METVNNMRQISASGFDVQMGVCAFRHGRHWIGQCAGNWILWPLRRRNTADKAIEDAKALLNALSASSEQTK